MQLQSRQSSSPYTVSGGAPNSRAPIAHPATIRRAVLADLPEVTDLMLAAVRGLNRADYSPVQLDSALRHIFAIDPGLLADGTYYLAEIDGRIAGGAGWTRGDALPSKSHSGHIIRSTLVAPPLKPEIEATSAKIRSVYVHPDFARRGIGRLLMQTVEAAARDVGITRLELIATLTGEPLYSQCGFAATTRFALITPDEVPLSAVQMEKWLAA